jgi:hypothetical protein
MEERRDVGEPRDLGSPGIPGEAADRRKCCVQETARLHGRGEEGVPDRVRPCG